MISFTIRPLTADDADDCDAIIRGLPDFFGHAGGIAACAHAVRNEAGWVAVADEQVIAFVTWERRSETSAELTWMAVERGYRHQGIGSAIVTALVTELRQRGFALALVMTAAGTPSAQDTYAGTRRFWRARGFLPLIELAIWETDHALLLVRPLVT